MNPVKVMIQKATLVPTKKALVNLYRTDWKKIDVIEYSQSEEIFKIVGNKRRGLGIEYDAQLAKWLVDNFGNGRYHIKIWKKGTPGFTFINLHCKDKDRFHQVPPKRSSKTDLLKKYKYYRKKLNTEEDDIKKLELQEKMDEISDDVRVQREIEEFAGSESSYSRYRKIMLIKNTIPKFKPHEYQEYGNEESKRIEQGKRYDSRVL